jgi:PEP-CTERM motif
MKTLSDGRAQAIGRAVRALLVGVLLAIGLAQSAKAETTYTYFGNPLNTQITGSGCPTGNPITGSFTLPTAISDNSTVGYGYPAVSFPSGGSFDFTACGVDYLNTSFGLLYMDFVNQFNITTDAAGVPIHWDITMGLPASDTFIEIYNEPSSYKFGAGCFDYGDLNGNTGTSTCTPAPGTWTVTSTSPTPTPEPASVFLFGTGLLGMVLVLRKSLLA